MNAHRTLPALIAPGILLLALTACSPGTGGGSGGSADGGTDPAPAAGGAIGDCMIGSWEADTQDLAAQLQAYFVANGTPATSSTAAGPSGAEITATSMTYTVDLTITIDALLDDGIPLQIVQTHSGTGTGDWAVEGDKVIFSNWDDGIDIRNTTIIAGTAVDSPTVSPESDAGGGVPMTVTCDGDTMTSKPDVSPFTTRWNRV